MTVPGGSANAEPGFWSGRPVAVTGASGFVGHHVATRLLDLGARVKVLLRPASRRFLPNSKIEVVEGSLEDQRALARLCRGSDVVFHLAGAVDFRGDRQRLRRVNVEGTQQLVAAARALGVRRLLYTSSIVAIGASTGPAVLDETCRWNLGSWRVPYVSSKREAEQLALAASDRDLEVVAVNPASVIGPDDFSSSEFGTLCRRFWRGRLPIHFGGGNNFVDVRDVALGHLLAAERGRAGERYILGGENRTLSAFLADLARVAGKPILRLRLPNVLAPVVAALNACYTRQARPYLTPGQARLVPLFFYFTSRKATQELGYCPRPLLPALRDAHAFWIRKRPA
jgi:dihydroflavonol-4-reductase